MRNIRIPQVFTLIRLKRINVTNGSRLTRSFVLFLEKYECLKDIMR